MLILLLDDFNEITREGKQRQLLLEQCDGLQVVVSSRFDMRENMEILEQYSGRFK